MLSKCVMRWCLVLSLVVAAAPKAGAQDSAPTRNKATTFNLEAARLHSQGISKLSCEIGNSCVASDYAEAIQMFREAAALDWAPAYVSLAEAYSRGKGVARDYAESAKWYMRSIGKMANGEPETRLGNLHAQGLGVVQSHQEAARLYREGARMGNAQAQHNLGISYIDGAGVPRNYVYAYIWLNVSAANNYAWLNPLIEGSAKRRLDEITNKMTPSQLAAAQLVTQRCIETKYADCDLPTLALPSTTQSKNGTGFFISSDNHIITNAHVVTGCTTVKASVGGTLRRVAIDQESDLALFIATQRPNSFARLQGGRGPRPGDSIVAAGYPLSSILGSGLVISTGTIAALSGPKNDRRRIQISAPVQPGSSGGPVHSANGSVVGVVVGKLDAIALAEATGDIPQNVNFAISLGTLQSFLDANNVPYEVNSNATMLSPADIATAASQYTLFLECSR